MPEHLSEDELRRISDFADRPMYEREPEQLLPDDEQAADSEETDETFPPSSPDEQ